ncbi:MAG: glycosyltransferase [Chloroflexota bacterium]|nr:glycosyltransferase [Chloroflexota bacterium]
MTIAVIATILNEGESIRPWLDSLCAQTRRPDSVVIVDGGSHDETVAVVRSYADRLPLTVIEAPGANISTGRNRAIAAVSDPGGADPIIAATDAGVILVHDWLDELTQPFTRDPALEVCGGFFTADARTPFEVALGASTLPLIDEIDAATFLPSSRSIAFRKSAWARVGGYPEWLDYCEDLIFDLRLKALARPFAFASEAIAAFRPRQTIGAFYRQYYRYARGDGKADLWRARHAARYLTYLVALPILIALAASVFTGLWGLLLVGGVLYLRAPYVRLLTVLRRSAAAGHVRETTLTVLLLVALVPLVRAVGDVAKMIGYPVGVVWRLRHRPPDWRAVSTDQ